MTNRKVYEIPGHLYFVTCTCHGRRKLLNQDRCKRVVVGTLESQRQAQEAWCAGFVVMPEHAHALIGFNTFDEEELKGRLSLLMQEWQRQSSNAILARFKAAANPVLEHLRHGDGHRVWTPKYYPFNVFTFKKAKEKLDYMHDNPVKRDLVTRPEDWAFSSAQWYADRRSVGVTITPFEW